jgi:galactoside O-acetyltransferase
MYVHIGPFCSFSGPGDIVIEDFVTFSHGNRLFTGNDDYSGVTMTGPMLPASFKATKIGDIRVGRGTIFGANAIVLPGIHIGRYAAIGAQSMVTCDIPEFEIWAGCPARFIKERQRGVEELERQFLHAQDTIGSPKVPRPRGDKH